MILANVRQQLGTQRGVIDLDGDDIRYAGRRQ